MVSRTFKTIKVNKEQINKTFFEDLYKLQMNKINEEEKEICQYCDELIEIDTETEEHICFTCCGDEITGEIEDIGLCPTCLEHI